MRMLDYNEFKMCQFLGKTFELSLKYSNCGSAMFIKRFMNYKYTSVYFDKSYLFMSCNLEDIILELNEEYPPTKNKILFSLDQLYWIGYIYGALSFLYNLTGRQVYRLFPANEVRLYYPTYHTFGIEQAAERMMENIEYGKNIYSTRRHFIPEKCDAMDEKIAAENTALGVKILKQIIEEENKNKSN